MGKESNLRVKREWEPTGTGRDLYDRDKMPEGCDPDVWHLTLYFSQKCESNQVNAAKNNDHPVIYAELKFRLTNCPPPDIRARARTSGITVHWTRIVELSIDNYFSCHNYPDNNVIDDYCNVVVFDYYLQYTIDTIAREKLLDEGTWTVIPSSGRQPSKRTEEQARRDKIRQKVFSEEEVQAKIQEFRSRT